MTTLLLLRSSLMLLGGNCSHILTLVLCSKKSNVKVSLWNAMRKVPSSTVFCNNWLKRNHRGSFITFCLQAKNMCLRWIGLLARKLFRFWKGVSKMSANTSSQCLHVFSFYESKRQKCLPFLWLETKILTNLRTIIKVWQLDKVNFWTHSILKMKWNASICALRIFNKQLVTFRKSFEAIFTGINWSNFMKQAKNQTKQPQQMFGNTH